MVLHRACAFASIICVFVVQLLAASAANATQLLRDAGLEYGLKQIATPILKAAGLSPNRVKVLIVDDGSLNAFVVSTDAIFIHSGLIGKLTSASQLQSVIAHEAAHIANGHLTRRLTNLRAARNASSLGLALAAAAAAAGSNKAAVGLAIGVQSSAQRRFFQHTRSEESSADLSAIRYMRSAGVPITAFAEVMNIFRGQEVLAETRQDPYVRTHPLSRDRIRVIRAEASASKQVEPQQSTEYWFARVKGKLTAYQRSPKWTLRRAGESGYADVKAIRLAMAHHQQSQTKKALGAIDRAIAARPQDPFLYDLKGQILLESRNFGAAVGAYGQAAKLAPRDGLILAGLGRAQLAAGQNKAALGNLERARSIDFRDGIMLRDLATAYAKSGQRGMASLVTAERYALRGNMETAGVHAKRAAGLLATGSGPWQRAQDVLSASERAAKQRKKR